MDEVMTNDMEALLKKGNFTLEEIRNEAFRGQLGAAKLFYRLFKNQFLKDMSANEWYTYNEGIYKKDLKNNYKEAAQTIYDLILYADFALGQRDALWAGSEDSKKMKKAAQKLTVDGAIESVARLAACGDNSFAFEGTTWDSKKYAIPFTNGLYDLKENKLRDYLPSDYIRWTTNVAYDPDAKCPNFEKFISSIFENNDPLIRYVRAALAYSICKDPKEQVIFVFWGAGSNGKTLLEQILRKVLGELVTTIENELIINTGRYSSSGSAHPEILELQGRSLCIGSETKEGASFASGELKRLSGQDLLKARTLNSREYVTFVPTHVILLVTNYKPHFASDDYAMLRRIKLIPFLAMFVEEPQKEHEYEKDPELLKKLEGEDSGIMNWLIAGVKDYLENGLAALEPEIVKNALAEYQREEDTIQNFLDDCCEIGKDKFYSSQKLYDLYDWWADKNGYKNSVTKPKLIEKLIKKGFTKKHITKGNVFLGLTIKDDVFETDGYYCRNCDPCTKEEIESIIVEEVGSPEFNFQ